MKKHEDNLRDRWTGRNSEWDKFKIPEDRSSDKVHTSKGAMNDNGPKSHEGPKSKYFGVDLFSSFVNSCLIRKRDGSRYVLPYNHLPDMEIFGAEKNKLFITSTRKIIIIHGRNFEELMNWLSLYQVKWIAESENEIDDRSEDLFIKNIEIIDKEEDI